MKTAEAGVVLERTVQALRAHSLAVSVQADVPGWPEEKAAAWLRVATGRGSGNYSVVVKRRLTQGSLGAVLAQLRQPVDAGQPPVLRSPTMSARRWRIACRRASSSLPMRRAMPTWRLPHSLSW